MFFVEGLDHIKICPLEDYNRRGSAYPWMPIRDAVGEELRGRRVEKQRLPMQGVSRRKEDSTGDANGQGRQYFTR